MYKKIILGFVTFALAAGAYLVLSSGDRRVNAPPGRDVPDAVRDFVLLPTTQLSQSIGDAEMRFRPGDRTLARVYDDITGRLKYQFEALKWEPISDIDFHVEDLLIQIYAPRGEVTYISADMAEVTIARKARNRFEPKRGWLRGNVKIVIDRTTSEWREANPDLADRYAHPEELINIDLQDARFDMDQAELKSEGTVLVDSSEARVENVEGLTLQWNQLDNRIDVLRFKHGGRMLLRRGGKMVDFAMPGTERDAKSADRSGDRPTDVAIPRGEIQFDTPRAQAMKPMSIEAVTADEAAAEIRLEGGVAVANEPKSIDMVSPSDPETVRGTEHLRSPEALAADMEALKAEAKAGSAGETLPLDALGLDIKKGRKRIHTYRAVFNNQVVVEQKDGLRTTGKLEADKLEINFDFGKKLRSVAEPGRPKRERPSTGREEMPRTEQEQELTPLEEDRTRLVLTWDGPLEMRPLRVNPSEQTGQRFDAIATGRPVKVESEQGKAQCDQLVYRHERRQVWLSGRKEQPVGMSVDGSRRLVGREIFFDQKRALARVDGAGYMLDERQEESDGPAPDLVARTVALVSPADKTSKSKRRDSVEIRWSHGVDIELGRHTVQRKNPSTGLKEDKNREFLQRAWFHGDVSIKQGKSQLSGDEVAVTFGVPLADGELADHIQHVSMSGNVRLVRDDDLITAERLDAGMTITPEGRNVLRIVDGSGNVHVRQGDSEFRAEQMHVVLTQVRRKTKTAQDGIAAGFDRSRLGIESLNASGDVFVSDPQHNLKIRKAEKLMCVMRAGNQLVNATILGREPAAFARVRYEDVAIHGHRIEIDMDKESVDVPGPGKSWMVTRRDFGGRELRKPAPVKTTWSGRMQFRLASDYGLFVGDVHSASQSFSLNCDKLTVRFGRIPPVREKRGNDLVERFWLLGTIIGDKAEVEPTEPTRLVRERKRPTYIVAEGNAEALSINYASQSSKGRRGRLLDRLRIAGDRIIADLLREQMSVPCPGTLLIEDYQFDSGGRKRKLTRTGMRDDPLMSSVRNEGPSQTLIRWENSMDFFVDRNLVAFDKDVSMTHLSGQKMVLQDELAKAIEIDPDALRHIGSGRKATLSCGYLLIEFLTSTTPQPDGAAPVVRATDLRRLIAKHAVNLQDGTKSLMGVHLQYLHETNEIRLEGSDTLEARIIDQDEENQRFNMWRGPLLIWNRKTDRIEAPGATIRTSRR